MVAGDHMLIVALTGGDYGRERMPAARHSWRRELRMRLATGTIWTDYARTGDLSGCPDGLSCAISQSVIRTL